jgi:hypothetical protein
MEITGHASIILQFGDEKSKKQKGLAKNPASSANIPQIIQKSANFGSTLNALFPSKNPSKLGVVSLSELLLSLDCLPFVEHDIGKSLENLVSSCKKLVDFILDPSLKHSLDQETLARSLLATSLRSAHKQFLKRREKDGFPLAKDYIDLSLRVFEHFLFDHNLLQGVHMWCSTLFDLGQLPQESLDNFSLATLKPRLPKIVQNLRSHNGATRLWTLEMLVLFARLDKNEPQSQTQNFLQVVHPLLESERMEATVETHRAKMMHLRRILQLPALPEPFSKIPTAYLFGTFLPFLSTSLCNVFKSKKYSSVTRGSDNQFQFHLG